MSPTGTSLQEYLATLDHLAQTAVGTFEQVTDAEALEQARVEFLGAKSGQLKTAQQSLGKIDKAEKPAAGKAFNQAKNTVEQAYEQAKERLQGQAQTQAGSSFDPTQPGFRPSLGRLHPITQTIEQLKDIAARLAFEVVTGPEIEDEWHNFEALNIPASHPARDPADNFYLQQQPPQSSQQQAGKTNTGKTNTGKTNTGKTGQVGFGGPLLLRSQTSTVQIRVMENRKPPVRIVSLGRVYRPDPVDATHYPMFHQVEGLLVDRGITMAHLKTTLRLFASSLLGENVHIRFRPSFFPFTEPSVEVDMSFHGQWLEMGGAGMVDPNVLQAVGYDPEEVTGFAFGLGVERICMNRFGIKDIRHLYNNDVRFLEQF